MSGCLMQKTGAVADCDLMHSCAFYVCGIYCTGWEERQQYFQIITEYEWKSD